MPFECEYVKLESPLPNNDHKFKCGDIFVRTSGVISLACGFCKVNEFFTLEAYSDHFNCHFQAQNQQTNNIKREQNTSLPKSKDIQTSKPIGSQPNEVADANTEDPLQTDLFTPSSQSSVRDKDLHQDIKDENIGDIEADIGNGRNEKTKKRCKQICELCKEGMPNERSLVQHKWRVHLLGAACRHCGKQFASERTRNDHEKLHTGEPRLIRKRKKSACNCKKQDCPNHMRRATPIRPPSKCNNCGAIFSFMLDLKKHLWTTHNIGHKCRFCEKQFYASGHRNIHERVHTGQHPYKCPHCMRTFSSKTPLKHHIMMHENDRPCLCTTCGKRFININRLKNHVRDKHPLAQNDRSLCTVCGMEFDRYYSLKKHRDKHHKAAVEILTCDICQRVFNSRKCLVQHMKLHSGKTYKCRYCDMTFAQVAGKRGHERNKHENIIV